MKELEELIGSFESVDVSYLAVDQQQDMTNEPAQLSFEQVDSLLEELHTNCAEFAQLGTLGT